MYCSICLTLATTTMKIPYKSSFCKTCDKAFDVFDIGRHRTMHISKKEDCIIVYNDGATYKHLFSGGKTPQFDQLERNFIIELHLSNPVYLDAILDFGPHKGETIRCAIHDDPSYVNELSTFYNQGRISFSGLVMLCKGK